jgi:YVTN family beta-propeller protein
MKEKASYKIFRGHNLIKALGITALALILLIGIVGAAPFVYVTYNVHNDHSQYGAVSVIDTATKKVTAKIIVDLDCGGVAATPNGKKLYVTNPSNNTVSIVDTTTKKVTSKVDVGWKPCGVVVTPDGTKVYVTNEADNTISVIDTTTNTVTATVDVGYDPKVVTVNPAGTKIYVNGGDTISVVDIDTNTVIDTVPVGYNPQGIAVTSDGTKVYVTNQDAELHGDSPNAISEIDADSNTVINAFYLPGEAYKVAAYPKGRWIYVSYYSLYFEFGGIAVYDTNTDGFYDVWGLDNSYGVAVTPDGKEVYTMIPNHNSVYAINSINGLVKAKINIASSDIVMEDITVGPAATAVPPVANFSSNVTSGYSPLSVQFNDASTGMPTKWSWNFGDNKFSAIQNPVYTYSKAGNYTVSLTVTNTDGTNTKTINNYIIVKTSAQKPIASFSAVPTSGNVPLSVKFTDTSTGSPTSWKWSFGDGTYSTAKSPAYTYAEAGNYTVSLTVKNDAGSNTLKKSNYINVTTVTKPIAAFSASPTSGKAPLKVQFTDTSSNNPTSWKWTFGDGTYSTTKSPAHKYTAAGKYTVSLTVKNAAGSNTAKKTSYITVK